MTELASHYVTLVCDPERHAHPRTLRSVVECAWRLIAQDTSAR